MQTFSSIHKLWEKFEDDKVFRGDVVCMLSMQFTSCIQIMILSSIFVVQQILDERMWAKDQFQNFDLGRECMIYVMETRDSQICCFFSLFVFGFACTPFQVQFSMIHANSDIAAPNALRNRAVHCSSMSMAISRGLCCWDVLWFQVYFWIQQSRRVLRAGTWLTEDVCVYNYREKCIYIYIYMDIKYVFFCNAVRDRALAALIRCWICVIAVLYLNYPSAWSQTSFFKISNLLTFEHIHLGCK